MTARARIRKILVATALLALLGTAAPARVAATAGVYYVAQRSSHGASHAAGGSCTQPGWVGATDIAIQAAVDDTSDGASVYICAGTYSLQSPIAVDGIVSIQGAGQNKTILDGGGASQLITSTGDVSLRLMTLRNGYASEDGGAIYSEGVVRLTNVKLSNNAAEGNGGAIASYNPEVGVSLAYGYINIAGPTHPAGSTTFEFSGISGHEFVVAKTDLPADELPADGGGVVLEESLDIIGEEESSSQLSLDLLPGHYAVFCNIGDHYASGMYEDLWIDAAVTSTNSAFSGNAAGNDGGAIFTDTYISSVGITKSSFANNSAGDDGGALRLGGLNLSDDNALAITATSTTFTWNHAENDGGAIYADGDVTAVKSTFGKNAAEEDGGAIRSDAGSISISLSLFSENTAGNNGGATYSDWVVNAVNSGFERNVAGNNGGAINGGDGYVVAVKDWFTENHAPDGGAVDAYSVKVARSTFTKNYASGDEGSGGAVNATHLSAMSNRFVQNHVDGEYGAGGAIAFQDELLYDGTWAGIKSNQFTRNTAYGGHADGSALAQWSACQDQIPAYYLNKNTFSGNDGSGDDVALYDYCA